MKPEEIRLSDWQRILVGEVPGEFYIELILRLAITFIFLILAMRVMGKRMSTQLSRTEMVALVTLAAAFGISVSTPDRGILPALITVFVLVMGERIISWWSARNEKFEAMAMDELSILVEDSVMRLDEMKQTRVSRERLFAQLRSEGLEHLGGVKRLYLEASGAFTVIKEPNSRPGLSVLPDWDTEFKREQRNALGVYVCTKCGHQKASASNEREACPKCGNEHWTRAVE